MQPISKNILLASANGIGFLAMLFVNYLANALPINGKTTGALSDQYPNLFVPAGFTFAIWGIIYISLMAFVVYQFIILSNDKHPNVSIIKNIGPLFVFNAVGNASWIFAWHYEILWLSLALMLTILITLILIYRKVHLSAFINSRSDKFFVWVPFSMYLGWISIATIANTTTLLVSFSWTAQFFDPVSITLCMIVVGILLGLIMLFRYQDPIYALVVIWALIGIYAKRIQDDSTMDRSLEITALLGIIGLGMIILIRMFQKRIYFH